MQDIDLSNLYDFKLLKQNAAHIKKIFFYRICGTGMGAAAVLLKQAGYTVEGGDYNFGPPMGDYLYSTGINCIKLQEMEMSYLQHFDLIIIGNIVAGASQEARDIEAQGVAFTSFPTALGALLLDSIEHVVGIAGTHGKTTTTYLATQVFENLGEQPGYFIGGVVEGREAAIPGAGKYFFIESDEYETCYFQKHSKFQHYRLQHMILTSLEFDHAEFFNDIHAIEEQFNIVIPKILGDFIVDGDYPAIKNLNLPQDRTYFYGKEFTAPHILEMDSDGTHFTVKFQQQDLEFSTNLIGQHNIENLTSVIMFALRQGFSMQQIDHAIKQLHMVKRRQEVRGLYKGALVIDDFAHHPRAVKVTLDALKIAYPDRKMVVAFGASSSTARSDLFQVEFAQSFTSAEEVIIIEPMNSTTVKAAGDLDVNVLAQDLSKQGKEAIVTHSLTELQQQIEQRSNEGVLLVILSNSNCNGLWESDFVKQIN